jgi:ABC-type glycerol-3-phosphate transport system permease component
VVSFAERSAMGWGDYLNYAVLTVLAVIMIYPFVYVFSNSISDLDAVTNGQVVLWPIGFTTDAYQAVLGSASVVRGYLNSIFYTALGTAANLVVAFVAGYVLAEKTFRWRYHVGWFLSLTLFLNAGLIPTFIIFAGYGLVDSIWAMVVPWAFSFWEIILVRTFIAGIPYELKDAARIDGASEITVLIRIIVPLSGAIIAVVSLFTAVDIWNSFFTPFIYLNNAVIQPLTIVLQRVLVQGAAADIAGGMSLNSARDLGFLKQIKMATIIVTVLPILCIYPFVQRFFVRGVLIGSIKE